MIRRRAAAAAEEGYAGLGKFRCPAAEVFRCEWEMGLPIFQHRHTGIRLDDDGLIRVRDHLLRGFQQLFRADGAVRTDDVCAHGIQEDDSGFRVGAGDGAAVFCIGHLADDGKVAGRLGSDECGLHLLNVDDGLDDERVCSRIGKGFCQTVVVLAGLIEGKIAQGGEKFPCRTHITGDLYTISAGCTHISHSGFTDGFHLIRKIIVCELDGGGAEGIRRDIVTSGVCVFLMDALYNVRVGDIVVVWAVSCRETVALQHGTHAAVKKNHSGSPFYYCIIYFIIIA